MSSAIEQRYFHVLIETQPKKIFTEKDLPRDDLITRFATPFEQKKRIQIRGNLVNPDQIQKIYFSASQLPLGDVMQFHQDRVPRGVFLIVTERDAILSGELCKNITTEILAEAEAKIADSSTTALTSPKPSPIEKAKVFVVHGRDDLAKVEVARLLEKLNLQPVILHEQSSGNKTIIEKIEAYGNVGFAIVIYSPCDQGGLAGDTSTRYRARQNVVFEHGYFIGRLGRGRVCQLLKGDVETPNDISGVVYTEMDARGRWQVDVAKELRDAGFSIDFNKVL
ncbi:nucleotide-binding protein [Herbaspirillum seropedicae]|uniref:nucleotide-binding protein n=1 Tax=Herbaspirillum seropedicae TaxID=964 RepID=UPI002861DE2F|nr:nucleotide-binding protein [Herbaspirillum seropedicae]MDR6394032.1 putative nucleotide-binding protein [Herbaspirillum seropedicae]